MAAQAVLPTREVTVMNIRRVGFAIYNREEVLWPTCFTCNKESGMTGPMVVVLCPRASSVLCWGGNGA
jgi:hypothetical protein